MAQPAITAAVELRALERRLAAAVRRYGDRPSGDAATARDMLRRVRFERRRRPYPFPPSARLFGPNYHGPLIDMVCEESAKVRVSLAPVVLVADFAVAA